MKKMRLILAVALLCVILPGISQLCHADNPVKVVNRLYDTVSYTTYLDNFNVDTVLIRPLYKANDEFIGRFIDSISTFPYINTRTTIYQPDDSPQHLIVVSACFHFDIPKSSFSLDSIKGIRLSRYDAKLIYAVSDSALYGQGFDKTTDSLFIKFSIPEIHLSSSYADYHLLIEPKTREDSHYRFNVLRNGVKLDMHELKNSDKFGWIWRDFSTTDVPNSCRKED